MGDLRDTIKLVNTDFTLRSTYCGYNSALRIFYDFILLCDYVVYIDN